MSLVLGFKLRNPRMLGVDGDVSGTFLKWAMSSECVTRKYFYKRALHMSVGAPSASRFLHGKQMVRSLEAVIGEVAEV